MTPTQKAVPVQARPLAPLAAVLVLAVSAHAVLVGCGGKSQENTQTSTTTETPTTTPTPDTSAGTNGAAVAGTPSLPEGEQIYKQRCVLCHGPQGKGDGPGAAALNPKPRDHTDAAYMNSRTDEQLLESIRNGKGQMPAWGKTGILNETQMRSVLMYVRTLAKK